MQKLFAQPLLHEPITIVCIKFIYERGNQAFILQGLKAQALGNPCAVVWNAAAGAAPCDYEQSDIPAKFIIAEVARVSQ